MASSNGRADFRQASVIGPTAWGTTLAVLLAQNNIPAHLVARTDHEAKTLSRARENSHRLPGVRFPPALHVTADVEDAIPASDLVVFAVPSQTLRDNVRRVAPMLANEAVVLSGVKGLELQTGLRMSEVICEEMRSRISQRLAVLSGPNLSKEVARGLPASSVVACTNLEVAMRIQAALMSSSLRIYTQTDVIGVELGGSLKNIIAIGAGMGDGLGYGANARAAFLTRGLAEITRLGVALGAISSTFTGLAGIGDLIATCASPLSRNRRLGEALGRGESLEAIRDAMNEVAEGVETTAVARALAAREGIEMPITEMTYQVLFERLDPTVAVQRLMTRDAKEEMVATQ